MVVEVGDHFFLLPVLVVLERLGVLVPEVVVDHRVQPGRVEVHVLLRVLLVRHCRAWCLNNTCSTEHFHLMDIQVLDSISPARVDDRLVLHVRDGEVVDGVVKGSWDRVLFWEGCCRADRKDKGRGA